MFVGGWGIQVEGSRVQGRQDKTRRRWHLRRRVSAMHAIPPLRTPYFPFLSARPVSSSPLFPLCFSAFLPLCTEYFSLPFSFGLYLSCSPPSSQPLPLLSHSSCWCSVGSFTPHEAGGISRLSTALVTRTIGPSPPSSCYLSEVS